MSTSVVTVILNPASSGGGGARIQPSLEAGLRKRGVDYRLLRTERAGQGVELARQARSEGASRVLVVGGDGTIHEVANGLLAEDGPTPSMAVLPVGTGNDFYRMVGAAKELDPVLDTLQHGVAKPFDVGLARWSGESRWFINLMGVGVDVEVLRRREKVRWLTGLPQYLVALLAAVVRFEPDPIRFTLDDGEILEDRAMLAAVTIGPSAGGGFLLCPDARPDDGFLDLCFLERLNYLQIARYIPKVIKGTHGDLDVVRLRRFRQCSIESPDGRPFFFQLDGELIQTPVKSLKVAIHPGRLTVLVPAQP